MKVFLAFLFVGLVTAESSEFFRVRRDASNSPTCAQTADSCCSDPVGECKSACSSLILDKNHYDDFSAYANENLARSFEYFFLSAQFGTFAKDRPGFEKVFSGLADGAWSKGIEMIKEGAKRGMTHKFESTKSESTVSVHDNLDEIKAMATAAEIEKKLLIGANNVHRHHSHASTSEPEANKKGYDAAISHFMEEEVIEGKTETVRTLVGHVNDLMKLLKNNAANFPLSLYLFDQYLQK